MKGILAVVPLALVLSQMTHPALSTEENPLTEEAKTPQTLTSETQPGLALGTVEISDEMITAAGPLAKVPFEIMTKSVFRHLDLKTIVKFRVSRYFNFLVEEGYLKTNLSKPSLLELDPQTLKGMGLPCEGIETPIQNPLNWIDPIFCLVKDNLIKSNGQLLDCVFKVIHITSQFEGVKVVYLQENQTLFAGYNIRLAEQQLNYTKDSLTVLLEKFRQI
jgi:hypothetical protein